jgi:hypothetical protein
MRITAEPAIPTTDRYVAALQAIEPSLTDAQRNMLRVHYYAPGHTLTMTDIAMSVGYKNYRAGNLWYGNLGKLLSVELGCAYDTAIFVLVTCADRSFTANGEWELHLRPEVAQALEHLGWV